MFEQFVRSVSVSFQQHALKVHSCHNLNKPYKTCILLHGKLFILIDDYTLPGILYIALKSCRFEPRTAIL